MKKIALLFTYSLLTTLGEVILNDTFPQNDSMTTTLFMEQDGGIDITDGLLERIHPSCRVAFSDPIDPCTIPLTPSKLNRAQENISGFQGFPELKSVLPPNDSCDFFMLYDPPEFGTLYLSNVDSSNITNVTGLTGIDIDSLFYYEPNPLFIGVTSDTFGLLKCGELDNDEGIYCDSIQINMTIIYEEPCDYTDIEKYCCVSTNSTFPCDVLANDSILIASIFPAPDYTVSDLSINNILMSPDRFFGY